MMVLMYFATVPSLESRRFIFDSVQFEKRSWQQRNRIKSIHGELLLTVPVLSKGRFDQKICDVELDQTSNCQEAHLKAIKYNYSKAGYFKRYIDTFEEVFLREHRLLTELNIDFIMWLKDIFGIRVKTLRSSSLVVKGKKAELLVNICKAVGADRYLSPVGAKGYIEGTDVFSKNGIDLAYHDFIHPVYRQLFGDFLSHLAVVDLLFNEGAQSLGFVRSAEAEVKK